MSVFREGCGEKSPVGDDVIVGVEGAFTGVSANPETDPTDLMMLLALIDDRYWPLHVCGSSGIGAEFNLIDNLGGNVTTEVVPIDPSDRPIEAHGCVLNCQYTITTDLQAECIVAKIDGKWQIIRVRANSFTGDITGPDNSCRCCGVNATSTKWFARILSVDPLGCDGYESCDEFVIRNYEGDCVFDPENPLGIRIGCFSTEGSELNDPADWEITVCGQAVAEIIEIDCCAPITGCGYSDSGSSGSTSASGSVSGSDVCRVEVTIRTGPLASCGGCDFNILIYSDPYDNELCAEEDVIIDEVDAEACGLNELDPGERVILVRVPFKFPGVTPSQECGPVEWYIIRACQNVDCSYPCEPPPPPPAKCCDILCQDLTPTLYATIEILDCDCACTYEQALTKVECVPGSEFGEWLYDPDPDEAICDAPRTYFGLQELHFFCGSPVSDSTSGSDSADCGSVIYQWNDPPGEWVLISSSCATGCTVPAAPIFVGLFDGQQVELDCEGTPTPPPTIEQSSELIFNGVGGTLIESSCNPIYSVFEFAEGQPICYDKMPGMIPFPDINCRVRITITE